MKILLLLCLYMFTLNVHARSLDKAFQLLPQPQSIEVLSGKGMMHTDLKFVSAAPGTLFLYWGR